MQKHLLSSLYLFIVTVIMVVFSWIGLADFKWHELSAWRSMPVKEVTKDQLSSNLWLNVKVLANTNRIDSRRVGVVGRVSENYKAFNAIAAHDDALSAFEYLLNTPNAASKVYAMHGFKLLSQKRFNALKPYFKDNDLQVYARSGCSVFSKKVKDIFETNQMIRH